MLEVLLNFERAAGRLSPVVLLGPGVAAVLLGLFVWLGGLGLRKHLAAVAGTVSGGACGFFLIGRNALTAAALAAVAAVVAIIFERLFIAILAGLLAAVVAFVVLAALYLKDVPGGAPAKPGAAQTPALSIRESIELMNTYVLDCSERVKQSCSRMPMYNWVIILAVAVVAIVAGVALWRFASALSCAVLGTTLIFAGMILLLMYKGSAPIGAISQKPPFYGTVFVTMAAFGTIEQLILCKRKKPKSKKTKKQNESGEKRGQSWRTS